MDPAPARDSAVPNSTDVHKKRSDTGSHHTRLACLNEARSLERHRGATEDVLNAAEAW